LYLFTQDPSLVNTEGEGSPEVAMEQARETPPRSVGLIEQIVRRIFSPFLNLGWIRDDLNPTGTTFPLTRLHPGPILSMKGVCKGML